jgi:CP family cyanate transporter-like MFS transporter
VRQHLQRPVLVVCICCYLAGWSGLAAAPLTATWLWMSLLGLGLGTFAIVLTLMGLRARTPESTAALSTVVQGGGYLIAAVGPLLVGVLRGATGGYAGVVLLLVIGWAVCRERYVDDEVPGLVSGTRDPAVAAGGEPVVEVAGTEPAVPLPERGTTR